MNKSLKKKVKNKLGFTLAETLLAVLILLLVSTIVATGIPAARNAYEKVVLASNAEVLLSTTISSLRNELGTAMDIEVQGKTITYRNSSRGTSSKIFIDPKHNTIFLQRYFFDSDDYSMADGIVPEAEQFISSKAATNNLYVTYTAVDDNKESGFITIKDLSVKHGNGDNDDRVITGLENLSIRIIPD